ncbi:hypothetical protein Trydic_g8135 [Trypoxylus dichotomus]
MSFTREDEPSKSRNTVAPPVANRGKYANSIRSCSSSLISSFRSAAAHQVTPENTPFPRYFPFPSTPTTKNRHPRAGYESRVLLTKARAQHQKTV